MSNRPKAPRTPKQYGVPGYTEPSPTTPPKKVLLGVVLGILVLAGIIAAVVSATADEKAATDPQGKGSTALLGAVSQSVSVSGAALPPMPQGGQDKAIGTKIPSVNGFAANNTPISIAAGKPMLIVGFAHWCPHCQAEVPLLVKWRESGVIPAEVSVIGISTAVDEAKGNFPPGSWLTAQQWSDPVLVDSEDSEAFAALGGSSFPYLLAVNAEGTVVGRFSGEAPESVVADLVAKAIG
jgi:cytochrome c biogenesis protein CcmG/thiol:disulfide interchange protein DsbE